MKFQCRMEDFFANSSGRAGRNRIFGDIFAPSSLFAIRQSASTRGKEGGGGGKDKERRGREGKEKKGTKADGKVWRPSPSYRPNYFRLVNAIFLKARTICIKAYICVTFKNTFK